jgi:hypothetical protein
MNSTLASLVVNVDEWIEDIWWTLKMYFQNYSLYCKCKDYWIIFIHDYVFFRNLIIIKPFRHSLWQICSLLADF